MALGDLSASRVGAVTITARHWTQEPDVDPGAGLETVYLVAADNAYDINVSNTEFENFWQYWYTWLTPTGIEQDDTLYTQILGTYAMGGGDDTISVEINPDAFDLTQLSSYLLGGSGDDVIGAGPGNGNPMSAYGGSDNDSIDGGYGNDLLYGDEANSYILWPGTQGFRPQPYDATTDGADTIDGHEGNDTIIGGGGDDVLTGGLGDDSLTASSGKNQFFGGEGSDTITGGSDSDFLYGGPRGTGQNDILTGGGGGDVFMLSYTDNANDGAAFWGQFIEGTASTVTGDAVENGLSDIFGEGLEGVSAGFISAGLGGLGQAVVDGFLSWIESLIPSPTPQADLIVVRDFDPSQDIIVLPVATGVDLSESAPQTFNPDDAGDVRTGVKFYDNTSGKVYAELTLGTDFLASVGLTQDDSADITRILNFMLANSTTMDASGNWSSLSNVSAKLPGGGFNSADGAQLPPGSSVLMFGAIGGLIYHSEPGAFSNSFIVGTQYADVLTINPVIKELDALDTLADDFTTTPSEIHGLGGDDVIYGGNGADILRGGDGNDVIYSFKTLQDGEDVSGGAGDDRLFGGGTTGAFDGGAGTDTFGVFYGNIITPMQLFVDLTTGQAGERAAPASTTAPVGKNPPFVPAADNSYTLTGIENVIGGTLNDWIRMTAGGTVEGGAGADYIDITAGGATLSYASSAEGVSVQLFTTGAVVSGGDAQGDVLNYGSANPVGLIGSAADDTLGGYSTGQFTFTGGGGSDLFQIVGVVPSSNTVTYTITDFNNGDPALNPDNDLIDLRLIGATRQQVELLGDRLVVHNPGGVAATIDVTLAGYRGFLLDDMVLFAESVSGVGRADPGGSGLSGGTGDDVLIGQAGLDYLFGNAGDDVLRGGGGGDVLDGGTGNDRLHGDDGDDRLSGGNGADTLLGGDGDDVVLGGIGHDLILSGAGDDRVLAGMGNDSVTAGDGNDVVAGGYGNDTIWGGAGDDRLLAGLGDDLVLGNDGADTMLGGAGQDTMFGGDGDDRVWGEDGDDLIFGMAGADWLIGGAGSDTIDGGAGRDIINGGAGADVLTGGSGADVFRMLFSEADGDAILDFNVADGDRLEVLSRNPLAVSDLGGGMFSFTDGDALATLRVAGASLSDFHLIGS
jgi:Ca2+-binding RTX toxin-like protein